VAGEFIHDCGRKVDDAGSYRAIISTAQIGSKAELKIIREGLEKIPDSLDLTLGLLEYQFRNGDAVYFTHSFAFFPDDPADVAASVEHGGRFPAAVARGNIAGVQFHPEKSQKPGLALLARFLEWRA